MPLYITRDSNGILRMAQDIKRIQNPENRVCINATIPRRAGRPVTPDGLTVWDYGEGEIYLGGCRETGEPVERQDPRLQFLLPVWEALGEL